MGLAGCASWAEPEIVSGFDGSPSRNVVNFQTAVNTNGVVGDNCAFVNPCQRRPGGGRDPTSLGNLVTRLDAPRESFTFPCFRAGAL